MKVALVHDWLTGMRGGERCLEAFCDLFPEAHLYTLLHVPGSVSPTIERHPIHSSFIRYLPFGSRLYRYYLPLFPTAVERFNLRGYDLVLSSSHCAAKGVRVPPEGCHISYIHTPMRYVWDQYESYFESGRSGFPARIGMRLLRSWLQQWDVASGRGVYAMVANSNHVAARIKRYYGRDAAVIHPPVDFDAFKRSDRDDGFYLLAAAFAPYKRVDLAIEAFNRLQWRLKIIGTGQEERRLKRLAGPTVEFLGWRAADELRDAYASCRALIFPGEEDFGIVPLEAMASGKPVIAYGAGGVLETVVPLNDVRHPDSSHDDRKKSPTGVFFHRQTPEALMEAVRYFEKHRDCFDPAAIREHVRPFDRGLFKERIRRYIELKYLEFRQNPHA
jgi:glycosyltransferase involved in cell wall biosynthesis